MARSSLRERLVTKRVANLGPIVPTDPAFSEAHPLLFDLLTRPVKMLDKILEPCRLSLAIGDGDWTLSVSDPVLCQSLMVRSATLVGVLASLEDLLGSKDQRWTLWKGKTPRLPQGKGKRRKKDLDKDEEI